jgi:hypothetical protein
LIGRAWWSEIKMLLRPDALRRLREQQVRLRLQLAHLRSEFRGRAG